MIDFLADRLSPDHELFEYGAGNSTLWFAAKARSVQSLEHTEEWSGHVRARMPANVRLDVRPLNDTRPYDQLAFLTMNEDNAYTRFILESESCYRVIVVDGIFRNACVPAAIQRLTPDGVLILDNTDYKEFRPALEFLALKGFRAIDFAGMCPITQVLSRTSVFYRDGNCFRI